MRLVEVGARQIVDVHLKSFHSYSEPRKGRMDPEHVEPCVEWEGRTLFVSVPRQPTVTPAPSCRASMQEDGCNLEMNPLGIVYKTL